MKKTLMLRLLVIVLAFPLILSLSGCGKEIAPSESTPVSVSKTDSNEYTFSYFLLENGITETDDSFYIGRNDYFYVIDKKTHKCIPLCSKPDCLHWDEPVLTDCDAFTMNPEIIYYMDSLYFIGEDYVTDENGLTKTINSICKMNLDGTGRQEVYTFDESLYVYKFKIHRGYIYIKASVREADGSTHSINSSLYKISADGSGELTEIMSFNEKVRLEDLRFYEDNMYIFTTNFVDENNIEYNVWHYDLSTGDKQDLNSKLDPTINNMFTIFNGKITYSYESEIYECDPDGSNARLVLDCKIVCDGYEWYTPISNDSERILITAVKEGEYERETMILCNKDYSDTEICNLPFDSRIRRFCNSESMLLLNDGKLYFIDKTKLGSDDCAEEIYTFKK